MKITRRQLRRIIKEELSRLSESSELQRDSDSLKDRSAFLAIGSYIPQVAAAAALGLGPVLPVAPLIAMSALAFVGLEALEEVDEASREATALRTSNIIKRAMAISLRRNRDSMSQEDIGKAYRVIRNGNVDILIPAIKTGKVDLSTIDLQQARDSMSGSAEDVNVDHEAVNRIIDDLITSLDQRE